MKKKKKKQDAFEIEGTIVLRDRDGEPVGRGLGRFRVKYSAELMTVFGDAEKIEDWWREFASAYARNMARELDERMMSEIKKVALSQTGPPPAAIPR